MFKLIEFSFSDFVSLLLIGIYFIGVILAFYLPMYLIWKDKVLVKRFIIPVAISVQIIFGYIFYFFDATKYYPAVYFGVLLAINGFALFKLKDHFKSIFQIPKVDFKQAILAAFVIISVLVSRFYDAININAPGNPDTLAHISMLQQLATQGYLDNAYYAPGFHLLLLPLKYLVSFWEISRFVGPMVGILSILTLYFLFKDVIKHQISRFILVLLLCLPLFNQFGLQTIGFFPSALTFIFLPTLIYLITKQEDITTGYNIFLSVLVIFALSVTVPYLYVQLIPGLLLFIIIIFISRRRFPNHYNKFLLKYLLLLILGLIIAFFHVYFATLRVTNKDQFPNIPTIGLRGGTVVTSNNYKITTSDKILVKKSEVLDKKFPHLISSIVDSNFYKSMLRPFFNTGLDILTVKDFLPFNNTLTIGSWIYLLVDIVLIVFSILKKNRVLLLLSSMGLLFGIATSTGFLEMSYYRGRSGWYYNYLMIITVCLALDIIYKKSKRYIYFIGAVIMGLLCIIKPLVFPRFFNPEVYAFAEQITNNNQSKKVEILTDNYNIAVVSDKIVIEQLSPENLIPDGNDKYVFFDKKSIDKESMLAMLIFSPEKIFEDTQGPSGNQNTDNQLTLAQGIKNSKYFINYKLVYEDENVAFYEYTR